MENEISIALLQILPGKDMAQNMEKGIRYCREAKKRGADIALFPEMWNTGYNIPYDAEMLNALTLSSDSEFVMCFAKLAKELEMATAITFLEKHEPKPRNTVCLFDRYGKLVYKYSKIHICDFGETDDESVLCAGDEFIVAELDTIKGKVKVGSMICYDREFPESARTMMLNGAELLLVPNACPMDINRLAQLRGRAYENMLCIATCNYPAPHPDCNGHSSLFDGVVYLPGVPGWRDTCILEADDSEGIFIAKFNIAMFREYRKREYHHYIKNRHPKTYEIIVKESTSSGL
ncbi:MAG: carbon-nitrogen hydrolase family protein [Acetatifactor muris]|nr:carbon-nitrogen hydrolase family protein [Acetatifactor muris]MCM1525623.1 carbon-nitrogen hydrolase family protein [Bacteroides sp.]